MNGNSNLARQDYPTTRRPNEAPPDMTAYPLATGQAYAWTQSQAVLAPEKRAYPPAKVLAVIPARGGSKGLPRKNAKMLCGKPLVAYSIEAALKSRLIDKVVVSTDDEEIFSIAKEYGPDIPLLRPSELATDQSLIGDAVFHAIKCLEAEGYSPDFVAQLYPTSPFRNPRMIDFLTAKGLEGNGRVITVRSVPQPNQRFIAKRPGTSQAFIDPSSLPATCIRPYGLYYGITTSHTYFPYYHGITDEIQLIDIDFLDQFLLAEQVIKNNLFDFDLY